MAKFPITLEAGTADGKLAYSQEIYDNDKNKFQSDINNELIEQTNANTTKTDQLEETVKAISVSGGASVATAVSYDDSNSQLGALNAQAAIEKLKENIDNTSFSTKEKIKDIGIDDEPTAGSENLVKSGGVYEAITKTRYGLGFYCKNEEYIKDGAYISKTGGITIDDKYKYIELPILGATKIVYKYSGTFSNSEKNALHICFYGKDNRSIQDSAVSIGDALELDYIKVPENAYIVRATINKFSDIELLYDVSDLFNVLNQKFDKTNESIKHYYVKQHPTIADFKVGYVQANGNININEKFKHIEVPVIEGLQIGMKYEHLSEQQLNNIYIAFYDGEDKFIESIVANNINEKGYITAPENSKSMKVSFYDTADFYNLFLIYDIKNFIQILSYKLKELDKKIGDIDRTVYPSYLSKEKINLDSLFEGVNIKTELARLTQVSAGQQVAWQDGSYKAYVIDLSKFNNNKLTSDKLYVKTASVNSHFLVVADSNDICLAYMNDRTIATNDRFGLTVGEENIVIDLDIVKANYPTATTLYISTTTDDHLEWYVSGSVILPEWIDSKKEIINIKNRLSKVEDEKDVSPYIVLPDKLYAVVGYEFNIYFDGVVQYYNPYKHTIRISADASVRTSMNLLSNRLRFIPSSTATGEFNVTFSVYSISGRLIDQKKFTLVVSNNIKPTLKGVFIGDSLTDGTTYTPEIQYNQSDGNVVSVGTREKTQTLNGVPRTFNHEGRGGWSIKDYMTQASVNGVQNAFYNSETSGFDFRYFVEQNGFSDIDFVSIYLGTNGSGADFDDYQALHTIIDNIHSYDPNIKILIGLLHAPATQDGCGLHVTIQNANDLMVGHIDRNKRYIEEYSGLDNVYICPLCINVDRYYDYPLTTIKANSRCDIDVTLTNNNVHLSNNGYLKFADVIYPQLCDLFK